MRPLPPAPFMPDSAEAVRKANEEGIKEAMALIQQEKEEAARLKIKREREQSPEGLFVAQDNKPKTSTRTATRITSGPYAGLQAARKRVRENIHLEENSKASFGPVKKEVKKDVDEDVDEDVGEGIDEDVDEDIYEDIDEDVDEDIYEDIGEDIDEDIDEDVDAGETPKVRFGPAKKVAKKGGGVLKNVQTINTRTMDKGPEWYDTVNMKQQYSRGDLQDLKYLYTLMDNAKKDAADGIDLTQTLNKIGQRLQQMEFFTSLSQIIVKKSGLLDDGGLRLIFENGIRDVDFPYHIRADADILFRKWMSGQIDPHLYRGIVTKGGKAKEEKNFHSHSTQQNFAGKVSSKYVGAGNLVNGQWWPLQMAAKRDGAHGEVEAGIHGQKGRGAYSVVISGGGYTNIDDGDSVKYCGTQGTENSPSAATKLMLKAYEIHQPLRLLRSASLPATNAYRPARGLRYDGLYRIIGYEILDQATAMHRFSLSRLGGQDPIRFSDEGMIPSNAQIIEFKKIRDQIG